MGFLSLLQAAMVRNLLLATVGLLVLAGIWTSAPAVAEFIRIDRCLDRGGRYDFTARSCEFVKRDPAASAAATGTEDRNPADTIPIAGPTVVAYFSLTQAEVDADENTMEALADFQHYLAAVERGLARCGVTLFERYDSPLFLKRETTVETFAPRVLEIPVGYRMLHPDLPDRTLDGVHTDIDLVTQVVEYFQLPRSCWRR